jgi:ParB family chromosome partitioning protein
VLDFVRDGTLSFSHVRAILTHPQPEKAAKQVMKDGLTVRQTEELARNFGRTFTPKVLADIRKPRTDPETAALAEQLSERLGVRVNVTFNGKNGAIIINYNNLDQLDEVLALLNR